MIPNIEQRLVVSGGVEDSASFGISLNDSAHIMSILRDTLYTDKILAVLREYGSNAWDAHRDAGKPDLPIKITLPTDDDPILKIRDFGKGLSKDDVFNIYTQYGASTKRATDTTVGMLGIGSKSGFAYADTFTITSWHDGQKSIYVAVLDESEKGVINLLSSTRCEDETGVEIQIAVKPYDTWEFHHKASQLYRHFIPLPDININEYFKSDMEDNKGLILPSGAINDRGTGTGGEWIAIMGCVPYKIDLRQLVTKTASGPVSTVPDAVHRLSGRINLNIGEAHISASREELRYTDSTKQVITAKLTNIVDEFISHVLNKIDNECSNAWSKRIAAMRLYNIYKLSNDALSDRVKIDTDIMPTSFYIMQDNMQASVIKINSGNRLAIADTKKTISGYHLTGDDYVIRINNKTPIDKVESDLNDYLKTVSLDGIPIVRLSSLPWTPKRGGAEHNIKHSRRVFVYNHSRYRNGKKSAAWDVVDHVPDTSDVYVILSQFLVNGAHTISSMLSGINAVIPLVDGMTMPLIYGYKTTQSKPITPDSITGTPLKVWEEKLFSDLIARQDILAQVSKYRFNMLSSYYSLNEPAMRSVLANTYGTNHIIYEFFTKLADGIRWKLTTNRNISDGIERINLLLSHGSKSEYRDIEEKLDYSVTIKAVSDRYQLLREDHISINRAIAPDKYPHVASYIKMIDELYELREKNNGTII